MFTGPPLTPLHLEHLYRTLSERGGQHGKPLGAKTVLRVHRVIRKALGDAERKGLIVGNPARLADKPSTAQDDDERPAWTSTNSAYSSRQAPTTISSPCSASPPSPACAVVNSADQWEDVDLHAQTVRVRQTLAMINGTPKVTSPKSRRSRLVIDIDTETTSTLRQQRTRQLEAAEFVGAGWQETGYVFTTTIGTTHHPDNISRDFVRHVKTLDVTYLTLHGLRHTHATQLLATGINPRVVSERLGHANVAFTLQVYGHVLPGQQREAAEAAAELIL
jgi:integrase